MRNRPFFIFLLLMTAGAPLSRALAAEGPDHSLTIVYTAETRGNLLPCSCPGHPLGGLARRLGFIDSLRTASHDPLLVVDAGRFLPSAREHASMDGAGFESLRNLHAEAAQAAGYDAIALNAGSDPPPTGTSWIRPNEAWAVRKGTLRVAIVAVDETLDPAPAAESVRALGPVDVVVLLCTGDTNYASAAAEVVNADIAVVARGACLRDPIRLGDTLVLGPGQAGKYVGVARCVISPALPVHPASIRLRAMDAGVPSNEVWTKRIEEAVLQTERDFPGSLTQGE